ncbi:hypothetical protein MO973_39640 [Paenibacillus sp. TRM 82003]|nr:hypothetical protein [Paenibacillus sp. TRM 82003]
MGVRPVRGRGEIGYGQKEIRRKTKRSIEGLLSAGRGSRRVNVTSGAQVGFDIAAFSVFGRLSVPIQRYEADVSFEEGVFTYASVAERRLA